MLKKLVVGTLATGIMLSGASGAMAATPNTESPKQEKMTKAEPHKMGINFRGYPTRSSVPNVVENGVFGMTWYLKNAWQEDDGTWTGYFEGWSND